MQEAHIA